MLLKEKGKNKDDSLHLKAIYTFEILPEGDFFL